MILYLMRHGQTEWNLAQRVQGWNDTPLDKEGQKQIRLAAEKLAGEEIETIYASDLKRARKSADIASNILDLPVHYTKRLREMNFGKAEGMKKSDLPTVFPYIYQAFNDINNPDRYETGYPEGETIGEVQQRFMKFINKLYEEGRERVLLVTHGMLVRIFAETCLKKTIRLDNGAVLRVVFDEKTKKFKSAKVLF